MMTTTLANRFKGYGWHLPDKILFNGQGVQIGKWTTEMEEGLKEHFSLIPTNRQHQVTLTAKAFLHMNPKVPQDFYDMINWCLTQTNCKLHIQIMEYDRTVFQGPNPEMEAKERYKKFIATFDDYTLLHKARIAFSFGNEPTLSKEANSWTGTLDEYRAWQANRIKEVVGYSCYIGNEADALGNLDNLIWHLKNKTKFIGLSTHSYKFKHNHPAHLKTLKRVFDHICDLASKPITTILISESSYSNESSPQNSIDYDLWAYHAPRYASDNGIRFNFFDLASITESARTMLWNGLKDLKGVTLSFHPPEMAYGEGEKIRNAQISVYLGLKLANPSFT